ncbi:hypothetical protein LLH06_02755 [Mucilaginibacter daejeonensis]|uniref:hypothetical protein n=1 Tax=Mucilaginibacter daejeonensis TaxID=398049 RepID=UPI001D170210|nr:hypothetical protein [Mucilaginibacter daejeonensis]UEG53893.1 hypothetical protein LLH06_02755 [Mucilaginibacter daejeonensis]
MKKLRYMIPVLLLFALASCGENPHNTFGGPSNNPHDTSASRRDTSSVSTRTDGHER